MHEKLYKYLQIETRSFVILGEFIPSIYHPSWLLNKEIITRQDESNAQVDRITQELCLFQVGGWLEFSATRNRMQLLTRQQAYFPALNDLVYSIFAANPSVLVKAIGINFTYSLKMPNEKAYYEIGEKLSGLEKWKNIFNSPKLLNISIRDGKKDKNDVLTSVHISPTSANLKIDYGVDIEINHHKEMEEDGKKLSSYIKENIDYYNNSSLETIDKIAERFID